MDTNHSAVKARGRGEEGVKEGGSTCKKDKLKYTQKDSIRVDVCFVFKRSQPPNLNYLKRRHHIKNKQIS